VKVCPYCAEKIQDDAAKCRHCNEWLDPGARPGWSLDFAALGEQIGKALVQTNHQGPLDAEALRSIADALSGPTAAAAPPTTVTAPAPTVTADAAVAAWEPPRWLAARGAAPAPEADTVMPRSAAAPAPPTVPEFAANEPAATRAAPEPAPVVLPTPEPAAEAAPRASLEEVAARMERLKATADAVQRSLQEKASQRASAEATASRPTSPRSSTQLQGSRIVAEASVRSQTPAPPRRRSGTMDRLEQSILGDDRDDFGDLDADSSGVGSTGFGDAVSQRRRIPWTPIIAGAAVVAGVVWVAFFREPAPTPAAVTPPVATAPAPTPAPSPEKAEPPGPPPTPDPAAGTTGAVEPPVEEGGQAPIPPAPTEPAEPGDDAFAAKLAEATKAYGRGRLDAARTTLHEALALSPRHPDALVLLAQVQLEKNELDDALATATTCISVDGTKADCWLTIAVLQEARAQAGPSLQAWQKYVELAPTGRYAANARKAIRGRPPRRPAQSDSPRASSSSACATSQAADRRSSSIAARW
jgi:hypothetical protein